MQNYSEITPSELTKQKQITALQSLPSRELTHFQLRNHWQVTSDNKLDYTQLSRQISWNNFANWEEDSNSTLRTALESNYISPEQREPISETSGYEKINQHSWFFKEKW